MCNIIFKSFVSVWHESGGGVSCLHASNYSWSCNLRGIYSLLFSEEDQIGVCKLSGHGEVPLVRLVTSPFRTVSPKLFLTRYQVWNCLACKVPVGNVAGSLGSGAMHYLLHFRLIEAQNVAAGNCRSMLNSFNGTCPWNICTTLQTEAGTNLPDYWWGR